MMPWTWLRTRRERRGKAERAATKVTAQAGEEAEELYMRFIAECRWTTQDPIKAMG